jgi:hypothetical protein
MQSQDAASNGRLSRPAFANQPQCFTGIQGEADIPRGVQQSGFFKQTAADRKSLIETLNRK